MSDIVEWVLVLKVQDGQAGHVMPLLEEMVKATKANEPGALHYEFYASDTGDQVTVLERYVDADAAMVHLGNFGAHFADRFFKAFAPVRFSVFGPVSDALREGLVPLGATFDPLIAGFNR